MKRDTLSRPRLDALLDDAVTSSIVIVRGARGSGKRVAVRDWLSRRDPGATLWSWIECDTVEHSIPETIERLCAASSDPESHLVVLSGFSSLHEHQLSAQIQDLLRDNPHRRVVLLSCEYLQLERQRTMLPISISVVPPHQLCFTEEETASYLAGTALEHLAPRLSKDLAGTPQLLRMAKLRAETMRAPASAPGGLKSAKQASPSLGASATLRELSTEEADFLVAVHGAVDRDLKQQLDQEVFAPGQLEFLSLLAVPTTVPLALLPPLVQGRNAEPSAWLADLEARGMIYRSSRNPEEEYCLHPVLRRVLIGSYLAKDAPRLRELHEICARFEMLHGSAFRALRHALTAPNHQLASDVLRMHADEYLDGELGTRGAALLDDLPRTVLARYPLLAICLAVAYSSTGKFKLKTVELLALAAAGARTVARKAPPPDRLVLIMVESVAMRLSGVGDASVRCARNGIALYLEMTPGQRDAIGPFEGALLIQLALGLYSGGMDEEAAVAAEFGVAADVRQNRAGNDHFAASVQAFLYALSGDIHRATELLAEAAPEHWASTSANPYFASPFRAASFLCAMESQRFEDAARWLELLRIDQHNNEFWPIIRWAETMLAVVNGETTDSLVRMQGYLAREREQPVAPKSGRQLLAAASSLLSLAVGDPTNAFRATTKSTSSPARGLLQGRVRLAQGDAAEVLRLCTAVGLPVQPRARFEQAVLVLAASLQQNNRSAIGGAMRMVAALSKEYGLGSALNLLPAPDLERILSEARTMRVELIIDPNTVANIPGGLGRTQLTARELAVLAELVESGSTAEIAERQFVSVNTVKSQLRSIYRKLGVSDRTAALDAARVQGLVTSKDVEGLD